MWRWIAAVLLVAGVLISFYAKAWPAGWSDATYLAAVAAVLVLAGVVSGTPRAALLAVPLSLVIIVDGCVRLFITDPGMDSGLYDIVGVALIALLFSGAALAAGGAARAWLS